MAESRADRRDRSTPVMEQEVLYEELRRLADVCFRGQPSDHTLEPTALVHEAYLRLADGADEDRDRTHFVSLAVIAMRQVLVDHARRRTAAKRGRGWQRVTLTEAWNDDGDREVAVLDLDAALHALADLDRRKARVVELRFFGGLTLQETADLLDISRPTVERDWRVARAWLRRELGDAP